MFNQVDEGAESDAKTMRFWQAHAIPKLFETDCGRAVVTSEEMKEWASTQEDEQLRLRVDQFLSN